MVMKAVAEAEAKEECSFDASEEAVVPKQLRRPDQPSQKEIDEHRRAGHIPYRSWCKCCVAGRGIHDQHQAGAEKNKLDKSVPCVSLDFAFMGDEVTEASGNAIVCTYDDGTDSIHTMRPRGKEP